jgi:hypothetical protein
VKGGWDDRGVAKAYKLDENELASASGEERLGGMAVLGKLTGNSFD